ncbi:GNAT family N-acetyltransferase [Cohnella nanjingensis]|uniref:GNAT family N-acetyltransferase n=1 Tax=Cohnella nanjingensis TaxID=1387779 RepID=A0A7X0VDK4_9BACL|nr:GNAT family N-acetyltransferase [Cohnella nanjingensis]MBB6669806.1 GNAT family N-acetyltransferase [Cohnella nanjingensis]
MIRWKRRSDLNGIVQLVRTELIPLSPRQHPRDRRLTDHVKERLNRGVTLVVSRTRGGEPFAFLHMIVQQETLFVDLLAVGANHQNRHWGSELMRQAEAYGRKHGCKQARLYVDEGNYRGQRFYQRLGYSVIGYRSDFQCYEMVKPLSANSSFTPVAPAEGAWHQSGLR